MSGEEALRAAVESQKQMPKHLRLKWTTIIEDVLDEGKNCSINEMSRLLHLNRKQTFDMRVSLTRLRYIGIVRKFGKGYELTEKRHIDYRQRRLTDFSSAEEYQSA